MFLEGQKFFFDGALTTNLKELHMNPNDLKDVTSTTVWCLYARASRDFDNNVWSCCKDRTLQCVIGKTISIICQVKREDARTQLYHLIFCLLWDCI